MCDGEEILKVEVNIFKKSKIKKETEKKGERKSGWGERMA